MCHGTHRLEFLARDEVHVGDKSFRLTAQHRLDFLTNTLGRACGIREETSKFVKYAVLGLGHRENSACGSGREDSGFTSKSEPGMKPHVQLASYRRMIELKNWKQAGSIEVIRSTPTEADSGAMEKKPEKSERSAGIREALLAVAAGKPPFAGKDAGRSTLMRAPREVEGIRAKTLSAAMQILSERGTEDLSLRAIADNVGIGLASIYHYFANKEELLLQLAIAGFHELREDIAHFRTIPEYAPPMRASAFAFFNFVLTKPALLSLMFDEHLMARHESLREAELLTLQAYRAAVAEDARIPPEHQENAAHAIWAMGRGIASIISSYPSGNIPPEFVEKLLSGAAYLIDRSG